MESIRQLLNHQLPILSRQEERELIATAQRDPGSPESHAAEDRLVRSYLRLVVKYAKRKTEAYPGRPLDDLIAAGLIGLLRAVRHFDLARETRLITYAVPKIRQAMDRELEDCGDLSRPRIPSYLHRVYSRAINNPEGMAARSEEDLAEAFALHRDIASPDCLLAVHRVVSAQVFAVGGTLHETPSGRKGAFDPIAPEPEEESETYLIRRSFAARALRRLKPRHRAMVECYFGLDQDTPRTLEETGKLFGVTRERVRQVVQKSLKKMRESAVRKGLCSSPIDESENRSRSTCRTAV